MDKNEIKVWLKSIGQNRYWLALKMGVSKRGVDSWLSSSRPVPKTAERIIAQLVEEYQPGSMPSVSASSLILMVDPEIFDMWNAAASRENKLIRQWALDTLNEKASV